MGSLKENTEYIKQYRTENTDGAISEKKLMMKIPQVHKFLIQVFLHWTKTLEIFV